MVWLGKYYLDIAVNLLAVLITWRWCRHQPYL